MTDEEMAEEYCNKLYAGKIKNEDYDEYGHLLYRSKEIREAFLAGLKAGRLQWHKVADGDLPKGEGIYLVCWQRTVFDKRYGGKFGFQVDYFKRGSFEIVGEYVIAWCEIPTFDKE